MKRLLIALTFFLLPSSSFAQDHPVVEVRTAFGGAHFLHADLSYTAPIWLIGVRLGVGGFAIEPEFAIARHEQTDRFNQNVTTTTDDRFQSFGVNVLGRWGTAVSGYAGGGLGMYSERSRYTLTGPSGYEQASTRGPRAGAQVVAGIDVPVFSRVKAFGQFRYEIRSFQDPGGGSVVQGLGGVAIALR